MTNNTNDRGMELAKSLKNELGDILVSVIRYERSEYLVVAENLNFHTLKIIKKLMQEQNISFPLFLKRCGVLKACDVFPMEFLNMKVDYEIIYGEDILKNLSFKKEHVARELEFELRTKLITLRQAYLNAKTAEEMKTLIKRAIPTMRPVCAGLLFVSGREIPGTTEQILSADYGIDMQILNKINREEIKENEFEYIIKRLIEMLEKLIGDVNEVI
ncbi:MAG: hypothetical protein CVT90_02655 [Candidatus Altiarchaeales archaeon HGW-Altiarchaeales-3]|nr:MAG: hypothetical protein CVT90_02655 [Candidatus Altiarchaeales archaeon HGW-Altiarchaeales-3]